LTIVVGRLYKAVDGIYRAVNAIHSLVDAIYKPCPLAPDAPPTDKKTPAKS
jgi:hypothetical protein